MITDQVRLARLALATVGLIQGFMIKQLLRDNVGAEKDVAESLSITRQFFHDRHLYAAVLLYHLANTRLAQNKWNDAETDLREAVSIARKQVGLAHPKARLAVKSLSSLLFFRMGLL